MQALILAAGRGSRLSSMTNGTPKPLLQIGDKHLVEHQLDMLSDEGIAPLGMVVGYSESDIREVVGRQVEYIQNARWATTNSLFSFTLAKEWIKEELIILNCDLLFHPDILDRILSTHGDAFAYDSGSGRGREQMKVILKNGMLDRMSKDMDNSEAVGENVGILKFSYASAQLLLNEAEKLIAEGHEKSWLGAAVEKVSQKINLQAVDVRGLPWGEIDYPVDLEQARKKVWPAIEKSLWKKKFNWKYLKWALLATLVFGLAPVLYRGLIPAEPRYNWESIELLGGEKVRITTGENKFQIWWVLQKGDTLKFTHHGTTHLRLESRYLISNNEKKNGPYAFEILENNRPVDWIKESIKVSKSAKLNKLPLGKRQRKSLDISAGEKTIGIRLLASAEGKSLVRVRQKISDLEEQ